MSLVRGGLFISTLLGAVYIFNSGLDFRALLGLDNTRGEQPQTELPALSPNGTDAPLPNSPPLTSQHTTSPPSSTTPVLSRSKHWAVALTGIGSLVLLYIWIKWHFNRRQNKSSPAPLPHTRRSPSIPPKSTRKRWKLFFMRKSQPVFKFIDGIMSKSNNGPIRIDLADQRKRLISALYICNLGATCVLSQTEDALRLYVQRTSADSDDEPAHQTQSNGVASKFQLLDLRHISNKLRQIEIYNLGTEHMNSIMRHVFIIHWRVQTECTKEQSESFETDLHVFLHSSQRIKAQFKEMPVDSVHTSTQNQSSAHVIVPSIVSKILKEEPLFGTRAPHTSDELGFDSESIDETASLSSISGGDEYEIEVEHPSPFQSIPRLPIERRKNVDSRLLDEKSGTHHTSKLFSTNSTSTVPLQRQSSDGTDVSRSKDASRLIAPHHIVRSTSSGSDMVSTAIQSSPRADIYAETFAEMDVIGDGEVDIAELRAFFASHGYFFTNEELVDFVNDFDLDENGSISFQEFVRALDVIEAESLSSSMLTDQTLR